MNEKSLKYKDYFVIQKFAPAMPTALDGYINANSKVYLVVNVGLGRGGGYQWDVVREADDSSVRWQAWVDRAEEEPAR